MMATDNRFPADASPEAVARAVLDDGYATVENLAPDLTDRCCAELQPHIDSAQFGHSEFLGARTRRTGALIRKSEAAQQLAIHDMAMAVCDRVLLGQCVRYQLNFTGIMQLHPGAEAQVLHRDGAIYPFRNPHPPTICQTMWAGTDFTAGNGGTLVVPRSHLWEEERWPQDDEVIAGEMARGSVLFYQSGTIHGAGANRSDGVRTGIAFQYSLGWLRQEENQHLSNPREVARSFPKRLQELVGYDFGAPYLGFVNSDDPGRLLDDTPNDGPSLRTRPELDEAQERLARIKLGDVEALPTPAGRERRPTFSPDTHAPERGKAADG